MFNEGQRRKKQKATIITEHKTLLAIQDKPYVENAKINRWEARYKSLTSW